MPTVFSPTGIRFENIDKRYGGLYALRRVSLEISAGECVVFAGRNGSGKTTLLRIAARLARPSSGTVSFRNGGGDRGGAPPPARFVADAPKGYEGRAAGGKFFLFAPVPGNARAPPPAAQLPPE